MFGRIHRGRTPIGCMEDTTFPISIDGKIGSLAGRRVRFKTTLVERLSIY